MITRREFKAYLQAHPEEVFKRRSPWSCPLATCLSETYDDVAVVSQEVYITSRLTHRERCRDLPKWAQAFIERVDQPAAWVPLTGAEALALLEAA